MKPILIALLCFVSTAAFAQADGMNTLTPVKVRDFVESMTEKTKPGGTLNDQAVQQYLNAHLADDGKYTSSLTFRIPGYPDQPQEISVDKTQFISNVMAGRKTMRDYVSTAKAQDIEVSKDKKTATLKLVTREKGLMPVEGGKYTPFTGQSVCEQRIHIKGNMPQIASAACQSLIEIKKSIR